MANQFVVQLKNVPGAMAVLAEELAARGVDLRAIGGGGLGNSGHVIMTTADDETTKRVLDEGGYTYVEGESIIAEVDDKPGGMARVARALADAGCGQVGGDHGAPGMPDDGEVGSVETRGPDERGQLVGSVGEAMRSLPWLRSAVAGHVDRDDTTA